MIYFFESGWPTVLSVAYKNKNIAQLPQKVENKAMPNTGHNKPELTDNTTGMAAKKPTWNSINHRNTT